MAAAARVSPARACAYAVLRRVFEQGAYTDRALAAEAVGLEPRERALAMTLAYGTVQRRATLDHVLGRLCSRPTSELDPPLLAALWLGLYQLLLLDGIAEHAAVHESVELAKLHGHGHGGAGLVNAVLRRATREGRGIVAELSDDTPAGAATLHSVPAWIAELWWRELGAQGARSLLRAINRPAESALRVNTLVATPEDVLRELEALGVPGRRVRGLPRALVLQAPFDLQGSALWARGAVMAQSRGSMWAARSLAPRPGERVLDLCAAPGAKTTQLAALIGDEGSITAVERHPGRAQAMRRTLARMHVTCATVTVADASEWSAPEPRGYDCVLVDPPCSGLGTLQSRPDLRWRTSRERIAELAPLQAKVLRVGAAATRAGGTLVYAVCTISRAESEEVVQAFLAEDRRFESEELDGEPYLRLRPDRDGTDGFFIARLRRR